MCTVSVIIVTYNRLPYLKLTIDSVLKQTFQDFKIVVVGDGDQIEVKSYIESMKDDRISYRYVNHCGYPAKARNLGIQCTNSPYIAFCDDDDLWRENKLAEQMNIFKNDQKIDLCCTNRVIIDKDGIESKKKGLKRIPEKFNLSNLLISNYISYSSVVVKREILEESGTFADSITFKAVEDYHLWLRIAFFGNIHFMNEKMVSYRVHDTNISSKLSIGAKKNITVFKDLFKKYRFKVKDRVIALAVAKMKLYFYKLRELKQKQIDS